MSPQQSGHAGQSLETLVSVRVVKLAEAIARSAGRTFEARFGLKNTDLRILNVLDGAAGRTVSEIARVTFVDKAWISRSMAGLSGRGLIERAPDPADARRMLVRLTASGRDLLTLVRPIASERETRLLQGVDRQTLVAELDTLTANAEAMLLSTGHDGDEDNETR